MNDLPNQLGKLIRTFNSKRVISEEELQAFSSTIVEILKANKTAVESLNADTKKQIQAAYDFMQKERNSLLQAIKGDLTTAKTQMERDAKAQSDRAFKRLQELIAAIRMPEDGKPGADGAPGQDGAPGRDGSPDTAEQVRDKLETLAGNDRLDASAIKGLPDYLKVAKRAGKQMLVGGIRFLENLVDVSVLTTAKRQDLLLQYNPTNNRWENGISLTVSATPPSNPQVNDLWVDIS